MGTSIADSARATPAPTHIFYSSNAWIDGRAVDQLSQTARLSGVTKIAAFPDLHPGKYGPVGCAVLSDQLHPHLIGNDIGCGMALFELDIPAHKLKPDKIARRLRALHGPWPDDIHHNQPHRRTLGTIGGGNHFCEVLRVANIHIDTTNITKSSTLLLVHSGSRSFGQEVFDSFATDPKNYLAAHDQALNWAALNRKIIATRAADALRANLQLIADSPHNLIEETSDGYLHRKGAAKADMPLVPLAGSRDAPSYLLQPIPHPDALNSIAHGAGRKFERRSMKGRVQRSDNLTRTRFGGRVVCEDKQLLIEEAPIAYKNVQTVIDELEAANLATRCLTLHPVVTFKKVVQP